MGPTEGTAGPAPRAPDAPFPPPRPDVARVPGPPTEAPGPQPRPPARPLPPSSGRRRRTLLKAKSSCLSFSRCGSAPCRRNRNFIILRPATATAPAAAAARRMRRAAPPVLRRGRGARRPGRRHTGSGLQGGGRRERLTRRPANGRACAPPAPPLPPRQCGKTGPQLGPARENARRACAAARGLPGLGVRSRGPRRGRRVRAFDRAGECSPTWRPFPST